MKGPEFQQVVLNRFDRVEDELARVNEKLDKSLEKTVKTETLATGNRGLIKILITGVVGLVGSIAAFVAKYLITY